MKWTYSIQSKMAASGALLTLCALVLFSNYIDQDHTNNVKQSISTLYEDRLVVENYILKMTVDIYEMKQALHAASQHDETTSSQITALLSDIDGLRNDYLKTRLTQTEDVKFAALIATLNEFKSSSETENKLKLANDALSLLNELSTIQLEESKLIMKRTDDLYWSGKAASQFAFAITIVILLVLQALVFASKTLPKTNQATSANLN